MVFTFLPNIPQGGDFLDFSYTQLVSNNQALDGIFAKNHYPFSLATVQQGLHKFVEMPLLAVIPTIAASEGGLYTKTAISVTPSTETDLFYTPDASTNEYQLTRTITSKFATFSTNTAYVATYAGGWSFLPGGLLIQYGKSPGGAADPFPVTFPVAFTSTPFSVTVTIVDSSANNNAISIQLVTTTGFSYRRSTQPIYWVAIGK